MNPLSVALAVLLLVAGVSWTIACFKPSKPKRYKAICINHSYSFLVPWAVVDTTRKHEYAPEGALLLEWGEESKAFPEWNIGICVGEGTAKRRARILNKWDRAGRPS